MNKAAFKVVQELMRGAIDPPPPGGRMPTDEETDFIIRSLADGTLVVKSCVDLGVSPSAFYGRMSTNAELKAKLDEARRCFAHIMFERNIASNMSLSKIDNPDLVTAAVAVTRQQHEVFKWSMGRLNPAAYGDKVTNVHVGDAANPIHTKSETKDTTEMSAQELFEVFKQRNRQSEP